MACPSGSIQGMGSFDRVPGGAESTNEGGAFNRIIERARKIDAGELYVGMSEDALQKESAALSRSMYEDYKKTYMPIEDEMLQYANNHHLVNDNVDRDVAQAKSGFDVAQGMTDRQMSRYGTNLTNAQRRVRKRKNNVERGNTSVNAANSSRDATADRVDYTRGNLVNLGRETMNDAAGEMSQAAGQEQGRNQRYKDAKAQNRASQAQAVGTGLMLLPLLSTKASKKNIKSHSKEKAYNDVNSINLKSFEYKKGGGKQVGVIREEAPKSIQVPDGKHVNVGSWLGNLTGAVQVLSDKIDSLEGKA